MKKSYQKAFTRAGFAALLLGSGVSGALAQTSGTLTPLTTTYSYSTAPWVPGPYPDGGGTATINANVGATPGTVAGTTTITVNVSPTLSQITYNTPFSIAFAAGTGTSIIAPSTGLTLNAALTPANTPTFFQLPNTISSPISGGGTAGLIKTGPGTVTLTGTNTFAGGTQINGGILAVSSTAAVGDGVFGAAGTAISFNGGALFANTTSGLTTTRAITLGSNGGTIYTNTATTLGGVISGTGALTNAGFANVALNLTAANTYTGATVGVQNVSNFALSGAGSITTTSSYDLTGSLTLTNTGTNVIDRLSDTAPMTIRGLNFTSTGNATAASSETIGAVTAASGYSTFLVTPGASAANSLTMASLTRQNNVTLAFRGTGLGGTPGAGVANIYVTAAPTLTGGGGGAGSTAISIVPYAYGNNTAAAVTGSSFVTYGANGFRTLDPTTEYATAFGVSNLDNVRLTTDTAAGANVTANAVLFAPAAAATLSGGAINITSGAFLYSPTVDSTGTVSAALNFGTATGVITNTSTLNLSGPVTGSGGVIYTSATAATPSTATVALSGASTYTGNTTINAGNVGFSGTVAAAGNASVFGNSGTIVLAGGVNYASLAATAAATLNRDISSVGTGTNYIANGSGFTFTLNGNVALTNNLFIYGNSNTAASAITFAGNITGTGGIIDTTFGYDVFSGNNSYSGGTTLPASSTFVAGSDTAFGTGPIYVTGAGTLQGLGTTARTLANPLFLTSTTAATFGGTAPLTFTGAANLNGPRSLAFSNTALTAFNGVVSNGGFTKTGTGAIALNSTTGNTFTGGFTNTGTAANSSAIYANNTSGSAFGTGAVNVGGASATVFSTLAGSFTTSGNTSIGGRLSPGNTPAALTAATAGIGAIGTAGFNGNFTLSSATTSSLYLEAASNVSRDQLNVGGLFTLNGTVFIATTGGYSISAGTIIDFADWGTISVGTVTFNTSGATVDPGVTLDTSFFTIDGTIRAVPEPTTWAMFGVAGALGLAGYVRRRRAA